MFLNRIIVGLESVLGMLEASADWRAVDAELREGVPPTTELGRVDAEWRARPPRSP